MFNLAWHLLHGFGVAKDERAAVQWLRKASAAGHCASSYILGVAFTMALVLMLISNQRSSCIERLPKALHRPELLWTEDTTLGCVLWPSH